jgi:hypothetical protein
MAERIMTLHPAGKTGVNIDKQKYDIVSAAIVEIIRSHSEITFEELMGAVNNKLSGSFGGSVSWYTTTVKLDLEARGIIQRVSNSSPQRLRLCSPD